MSELKLRLDHPHQARILGRPKGGERCGAADHVDRAQVIDRGDQERSPRLPGELLDARRERALHLRWDRHQPVEDARLRGGQLEDRQRVAVARLCDLLRLLA